MTAVAVDTDRHDPGGRTDYLSLEHVERYRFAAARLPAGARVLDVATGIGYGAAMLREGGRTVVGADCDAGALAAAKRRHGPGAAGTPGEGGSWVCADARALPFADACFDAVVSFETVEHVVEGERMLGELWRVLRPGGVLVCSTPNIAYTAHPAFHVKEYRPREFFALCERALAGAARVERHAQYFRAQDRLRDLYAWHLQGPTLRVADALGIRPLWHRLKRRGGAATAPERGAGPGPIPQAATPPHDAASPHRVVPYRDDRMLRIMVAVATKGAAS